MDNDLKKMTYSINDALYTTKAINPLLTRVPNEQKIIYSRRAQRICSVLVFSPSVFPGI